MIISLSLGIPLVRSYTKRVETRPRDGLPGGEIITRLDRIEQAIEAMSTEVERIAEGQRFTTKLLSPENRPVGLAAVAAPAPATPKETAPAANGTILIESARRT